LVFYYRWRETVGVYVDVLVDELDFVIRYTGCTVLGKVDIHIRLSDSRIKIGNDISCVPTSSVG